MVTIINCSFHYGHSDEGGALKITSSKVVFLNNIKFEHNRATIRGASIFTNNSELLFNGNISFGNNKVKVKSVFQLFFPNDGKGGAICALNSSVDFKCGLTTTEKSKQSDKVGQYSLMTSVNCHVRFFSNSGSRGGAIYSSDSTFSFEGRTDIVSNNASLGGAISSKNSKYFFNGLTYLTENFAINVGGAIVAEASTITFHKNVLFANNFAAIFGGGGLQGFQLILKTLFNLTFQNNSASIQGGGLRLFESEFIVSGCVNFFQNEAGNGGGMYLQDTQIVMKPSVQLIFHKNKAKYGGAIFYLDTKLKDRRCYNFGYSKTNCFINVTSNSITHSDSVHFYFHDNIAVSGSDIFGGNLDVCDMFFPDKWSEISGLNFIFNVSTINHTEYDNSSISSNPLYICRCEQEMHKCAKEITLHIPHGKKFYLSVVAVGQNNSPVPSEIIHSFISSNGAELRRITSDYNENSTSCQNISFQLLSTDEKETFRLYPTKCESDASALSVTIHFEPCPPGFELTTNICECENKLKTITETIFCDIETSLVKHPGKIWIRPILTDNLSYNGFMWTTYCPKLFCKIPNLNTTIWLNFSSSNSDNQCQRYHTGIWCGSCKKNYSLVLNSLDCRICNNTFIVLTIVFIFAGIAMIVVLLFLHITVAFGTINGLILYANIFNISKDLFFPPEQTEGYVLPIFISWLNLDFGISTCYFRGLDIYLYTWLQFAFPFYLWGLVGIIIITSRYSTKVARLLGSNPVAVLATVILMSYTKLLHTSYNALSYSTIKYSNDDHKKVWKLDPNIPYFKDKHIPLAAFSLCVIIFLIIPYILVILLGYQIQAFSHKKRLLWINKFKPLLDSYYAPYQKNTRFWTGFLLVVRTCLYITYTLTEDTEFHVILIAESSIFAAILLIPWLRIHVYEKKYLEKLEASFIFNILILSAGTHFLKSTNADETILPLFSVGIAFIEFIGIVFFHIVMCLENWKIKMPLKVWKVIYTSFLKKFRKISVQQRASDEVINANVEHFTTTSINIREPLLEEDITEL